MKQKTRVNPIINRKPIRPNYETTTLMIPYVVTNISSKNAILKLKHNIDQLYKQCSYK